MSVDIHQTAIVDPRAELGADVAIGPFCCIGPNVRLGDGVRLHSHVVIDGRTTVGAGTQVFPFASLGLAPQDLKYSGEPSTLTIGARNRIREYVTMNPGTEGGGMETSVGDDGLFMVGAHVAHDCRVGNRVIMANNATLAGHVILADDVILGGLSAVHQFVRIGAHAMIGGMSGVEHDVIPYGLVLGDRARLAGLNLVGLKRRGFADDEINEMRAAFRMMFGPDGTLAERVDSVADHYGGNANVRHIVDFIQTKSSRALCLPRG